LGRFVARSGSLPPGSEHELSRLFRRWGRPPANAPGNPCDVLASLRVEHHESNQCHGSTQLTRVPSEHSGGASRFRCVRHCLPSACHTPTPNLWTLGRTCAPWRRRVAFWRHGDGEKQTTSTWARCVRTCARRRRVDQLQQAGSVSYSKRGRSATALWRKRRSGLRKKFSRFARVN